MKLVIIYGPPGVGKLTVANELSKITGYKVFHNHLTIELARSIWNVSDPKYLFFRDKYREMLVRDAARSGVRGMIFTYAYGNTAYEDAFLKKLSRMVKSAGGSSVFVQLCCNIEELRRRVLHPSRRKYSKISTVKELHREIKRRDVFSSVRFAKSMKIDNTNLSAKKAAAQIAAHYKL